MGTPFKIILVVLAIVVLFFIKHKLAMDAIIRFIIKRNEGGFQKDPNDTGNYVNGKLIGTKYGIAAKYHPKVDIPNLTLDGAIKIYRTEYLAKLPVITNLNLLYHVLDMAINAGVKNALKMYRPGITTEEYQAARLAYYKTRPDYGRYHTAWDRRAMINYLKEKNNV